MAQGVRLTDQQIAILQAAWVLTQSGSYAARKAGCAAQTANAYIRNHKEELLQLLHEKAPDIIDQFAAAREEMMLQIMKPDTLKTATVGELAKGIGIFTDKIQLLNGEATSRNESSTYDPSKLTREERQQLIEIRAKMEAKV